MTDTKRIARILRSRLGKSAPVSTGLVEMITLMINRRTPGQPLIMVDFTRLDTGSFERFRRALQELKLALSDLIEETAVVLDFFSASGGEEAAADARTTLNEFKRLAAEVALALSRCGPPSRHRQSDRRSQWHAAANAFAMFIEYGYRAAGLASPLRSHVTSPLVGAVRDLLAEAEINCTLDAVAKALRASARSKRRNHPH